ncbi:MAG: polysaccharide export protein EpsE [Rubrivivax sp.]|nr:MAG: polysaccharide export protein EpsE [Rubrivivax sp.]
MRHIVQWLLPVMMLVAGQAHSATQGDYVLGAGDLLRITVFQNADLTLDVRIAEGGTISYPLLGTVKLGGLSVSDAEKKIADGLRTGNFLKAPQVSILVTSVKANQVSVLGQVYKPGRYPLESGSNRLSDILAQAGGAIAQQGSDIVVVSGKRNGKPFRKEIDFPLVFAASGTAEDFPLENNDAIWVDRAPQVYIYGEVLRGGTLRLERDMTLLQALASVGGLTQRGTAKGIKVHRRDDSGRVQIIEPGMNDKLQANDVIYVKESLF